MVVVKIDIDNAAFDPDFRDEAARLLRVAADKIETAKDEDFLYLRDINGNLVGNILVEK